MDNWIPKNTSDEENSNGLPNSIIRMDQDSRSSSDTFTPPAVRPSTTTVSFASTGDIGREHVARSSSGLNKARAFARDMLPNLFRRRSSSSSLVSPFEFGRRDSLSEISIRGGVNNSSSGDSTRAETIELLFGPFLSHTSAQLHTKNNRALAEVLATDHDMTVSDELSLCTLICPSHRTDFHNRIASTKYRLLTFVPLNLWEQFHRVANLWFLLVGICQMLPYNLSPTSEWATIVPLVFVLSLTMIKDAIEDYRRYMNDTKVNKRLCRVVVKAKASERHDRDVGGLELIPWENITSGSLLYLRRGEEVPADMLLIATSDPDGTVYVETSQLDGESALKVKQALPETRRMFSSIPLVSECVGSMTCDAPNALIDEFNGLFRLRGGLREPADAKNLVLRGSSIRNTAWCCGVVVYVGRDTKLAMNMTPNAPIKRSKVELQINRYLGFVLGFMLALSLGLTIAFACTRDSRDRFERFVGMYTYSGTWRQQFLTFLLLFNNMVPISLYVTVDIVRSIQAYFIQRDPYLKEGQHSIIVGASGLNDDLGRVDYVLVDKTGTLTENRMSFKTCSIGGVQYGSEEKAPTAESIHSDNLYSWRSNKMLPDTEKNRLRDEALLEYLGVSAITRPQDAFVHLFMLTCAICNTVIVETSTKSLIGVRFQGASPDEEALVEMAASSGYILTNRSSDFVSLRILRPSPAGKERQWEDTTFKILGVNEFTSERKRMSILVQIMKTIETDEGDIAYIPDGSGSMLLVKGADDVMVELCQRGVGEASAIALCGVPVRDVREETVFDINEFASTGLRTLMLAMRYLDEVETSEYLGALNEARHSITNRADRFAQIADKFETNLIVLGATAVEDKIQRGVNITVCRMLNAGVKVWMLTGDRYETSLNIARAVELLPRNAYVSNLCSNYERGMSNEAADAFVRQKQKNFEDEYLKWTARGKTSCLCVVLDGSAIDCFSSSKSNSIILSSILMNTGSVVACRCSPSQKALIVQLLKKADDCITLAIGDGANDVPMLEVANIGIGVIGSEGMQAVRASDYAIATFSHLGQLMLIHGRDCYNRITLVILYSFFKNIFLILPNVFFALSNAFTGTSLYDSWILMSYNVFWTSLPIIVIGAMDITLPRWVVVRYPIVYVEGRKSFSFNARKFIVWILGATFCAAVAYVSVAVVVGYSSVITPSGELMSHACMGTLIYYSVVIVVNCILVVLVNHLSSLFLLLCSVSIIAFVPFLSLYSRIGRPWSKVTNVAEMLWGESPITWLVLIFVIDICVCGSILLKLLVFSRDAATPVQQLQRWLAAAPSRWTQQGLSHIAEKLKESFPCVPGSLTQSVSDFMADASVGGNEVSPLPSRTPSATRLNSVVRRLCRGVFRLLADETEAAGEHVSSQTLRRVSSRTLEFKNIATESGYRIHSRAEAIKHIKLALKIILIPLWSWWMFQQLSPSGRVSVSLVIIPVFGTFAYLLTFTRFCRRNYTTVLASLAFLFIAEFYVMRIVDGVDDSLLAAWIPFSVHIAAQIRFPRALALSIVHIICFITIHLVRTLEIHHGSSMDGHDSRDCGVEFNNLCQLLDYLPMMLAITSMSAALGYKTELDQRSHYLVSLNSKVEQSRSKEVLNNMLPDFVVDSIIEHNRGLPFGSSTESRLLSRRSTESSSKTGSSRIPSTLEIGTFARHCGDVTVLFCDVADFPQLVAALVPKQLILMIHRLFSNIDKLVFVHALTKLETVSESYVVCSGLNPDGDSSDHVVSKDAFRAVLLGLDILDNTAHMNVPAHTGPDECMRGFAIALVLKIGIHTGPVISGVVGSKRPQFCIFGDTINTASRMKSTAIPNRVHLSASTRECLEFSSSLSFEERETFVKGKGVLMTYDASRVVDSSHLQDVGAMSTSRDLAVSFDTSKVEKLGGIEPLRRHSQASLGGSATSTLTAPVRKLIASLKPSIRWRNGAEESLDEQAYDAFHSSSPWLAGSDVSCNERTINFDKSRDLNLAVEALRRNNDRYDVQKEHAVERMDLGKDRASMYTMEFLQSSYEIRFREGRLMTFVTSRSTRYVLLILSVSYLIQTIELLVAPQQPQVIFSRVLLARLTVWILLMVLYVLYSLRSLLSAPALRLLTVGVYAIGILVASLHTLVFVENVRRDDCDADDPTCSNLSITESPAATGYHSYANSLELTMWLIMINFNAALLFKHLLYINIIILIPVVISWNFSEYIGSDLAAETSALVVCFAFIAIIMARMRESWKRRIFLTDIEYQSWQKRAHRLLSEFMPSSALEAYLADRYMASLYKNMTLLLADICNYTAYAKSAPAERVVSLLTTLFSRFDSLSDTYAVYKVHTIGDAYVASTEPKEGVDKVQSARRMVSFAQAMVEALHTVRQEMSAPDLEMRIGLHFGKFVGGVIATTKISYDIFGVDVTIANQVETAGIPGKIVASNSLRGYLVHYFPGKYRFRFHTTIETLVPDDSKKHGPANSHQSVVAKQLKIYEISTSKMQYGQFDTVI